MNNNLFQVATRKRYRFETHRGLLSVEDLWLLSLEDLDNVAKNVNAKLKEASTESFITRRSTGNQELENKLEIVKAIIETKLDEQQAAKIRSEKAAKIAQLKTIAGQKATEALGARSLEDIQKMIKELEEEQ